MSTARHAPAPTRMRRRRVTMTAIYAALVLVDVALWAGVWLVLWMLWRMLTA